MIEIWINAKDRPCPRDGSPFWAYLYTSGIRKVYYQSPEEIAVLEGGEPDDYDANCFVQVDDDSEVWNPSWWLPESAIPDYPKT